MKQISEVWPKQGINFFFFFIETSQFLYLVAFLVACAKLSDSRPRDVAKIKQTKRKKDARDLHR